MSNKKGISFERILELYQSGKNIAEIAEEVGCKICNVSNRLKKKGFTRPRDYTKTRYCRTNKLKVNLNFFKNILTEEQAYFLGIMFADGSVTPAKFYLKLKDEDVIVKFKEALNSES